MEERNVLSVDLYDNVLTERKGDYTGKIRVTGSFRNADIARRIVAKRTEYRAETIENILNMADQEKAQAIVEGKSIVDGVGQYQIRVIGSFEGEKAPFNPALHQLSVSYSMGKNLRELMKNVAVQTSPASTGPVINEVTDVATGLVSSALTNGSNVVISGYNIKIAGEDPSVGVFLTKDGGPVTKVKLLVHNNPSQLTVLIPSLPVGDYTLSVVTQYTSGNKLLKEPRTYVFPTPLLVEAVESERPDEI